METTFSSRAVSLTSALTDPKNCVRNRALRLEDDIENPAAPLPAEPST
jgi:hypothetical protein